MSRQYQPPEDSEYGFDAEAAAEYAEYLADCEREEKLLKSWEARYPQEQEPI